MKKFQHSVIAAVAALALAGTSAPGAHATETTGHGAAPAGAAASVQIPWSQIEKGSLTDRVNKAKTFEKAASILEKAGFNSVKDNKTGEVIFEKTVEGITLGFNLGDPNAPQLLWGTGWNWGKGGPYIKATAPEWNAALTSGSIVGGAMCAFITATAGTAACAAVAGLVTNYLSSVDTSGWPSSTCLAIAPLTRNTWIERC